MSGHHSSVSSVPYNGETKKVQDELRRAWQDVQAAIKTMRPSSQIRPADVTDVFRPNGTSNELKFNVAPMVFNVPERANGKNVNNLYVVVSGWLAFGAPVPPDSRRTTVQFGTRVGYFREKGQKVEHIYGVHYDMDETLPGHPVFHAQMSSQVSLWNNVNELFKLSLQLDTDDDVPCALLRNVRIPTAQMDVFSVITQIGADHLIYEKSNPEVQAGFTRLRKACDFFVGAAGRLAYLNSPQATCCYRSTHWYARNGTEPA